MISEIKIKHLQPEKLQNLFEKIQKMKKSHVELGQVDAQEDPGSPGERWQCH